MKEELFVNRTNHSFQLLFVCLFRFASLHHNLRSNVAWRLWNIPPSPFPKQLENLGEASFFYSMARYMSEGYAFWSQLVLTLALACERFILIVKGNDAKSILSPRRRVIFYSTTVIISVLIPTLFVMDFSFVVKQNFSTAFREDVSNDYELKRNVRFSMQRVFKF